MTGRPRPATRGWVAVLALAASLVLVLGVIVLQVQAAIGSAHCRGRADLELILCASPPDEWQFVLTVTLAVALSVLMGMVVGAANRRGDAQGRRAPGDQASRHQAPGP